MDRQIFALKGLNFSYWSTQAVLGPFLPLYFHAMGYSASEIGLLMSIGPFVAIFAQPLWGIVSDKLGKVKLIILMLWILGIITSIGVFNLSGFQLTLLFTALMYFFLLPSVPLLDSISTVSAERQNISYGSIRLWGSAGYMIMASLSGYLLTLVGGIKGIPQLYWIYWILPLIILVFLKDEKGSSVKMSLASFKQVGSNVPFLRFLFLFFILAVPHRMNDIMFSLHLGSLGASDTMSGWAWALAAGSEIPTFALLGRYMNRFHELTLLGIVSLLYVLRWIAVAQITDPQILMLTQLSHSVTFAVMWIIAVQYTVRIMPRELNSTGQGLLAAVFLGLAGITSGLVGGWINDHFGGSILYWSAAGMSLVAAILFFAVQANERRKAVL